MNTDLEEIIENAKERISYVKTLKQDQTVVLTVDDQGNVTYMHNTWNTPGSGHFDPSNPCDFTTPVNKGKTITWIGNPDPQHMKDINVEIDYVLMNITKGKQILKKICYHRGPGGVVIANVKNKTFIKGDIEYYYIVYSVIKGEDRKTYILDPKMDPYGEAY